MNTATGGRELIGGDWFFSSMPVKHLMAGLDCPVPADARKAAEALVYRNMIVAGLLLKSLGRKGKGRENFLRDNWIYIQEKNVKVGRMQIFNNWSPYLVRDRALAWVGLEYFCGGGDELWLKSDGDFVSMAVGELEKTNMAAASDFLEGCVIRVPLAYPVYSGGYGDFGKIRGFLDGFENLFLVGRNGMHRYNNQDHSMLTAMTAVDNIAAGVRTKDNIWGVNVEKEYSENK